MPWPVATDYQEAIQNPQSCFSDQDLKRGSVKQDRFGLPRPISGMFASVYEMKTPSGRWAVRCFLKPVEDQQRRYSAISAHLKAVRLKSGVGFDFIPHGIRIRSQWYPILKMEWIDGEPLNTFVGNNISHPRRLLQLTREWVELMQDLRVGQIAHGDLQHGNILVTASGLRLIDYDGMYVPALSGLRSYEEGHRNYQHPDRSGSDFGPYLDHFSAWVIFCSLAAVAVDPHLWQIAHGGDECLLFRGEDFKNPATSRIFQALESGRPELRALALQFRSILSMSIRQVPALDGVTTAPATPSQKSRGAGAVPDWLADHVQPKPRAQQHVVDDLKVGTVPVSPAADWIIDQMVERQAPAPTLHARSFLAERTTLVMTSCATVILLCIVPALLAAVLVAIAAVSCAALLIARYQGLPAVRGRYEAAAMLRDAQEKLQNVQAETRSRELEHIQIVAPLDALNAQRSAISQKLSEDLRGVQDSLGGFQNTFASKRQLLGDEEANELRAAEQEGRRQLDPLKAERNGLDQKEREEIAAALRNVQQAHMQSRLLGAAISQVRLRGIGPKLKAKLKAQGIVTAGDVTYQRIKRVQGIGVAKTSILMDWKNNIIRCNPAPGSLSQEREYQIRSQYGGRRQSLDWRIRTMEDAERRSRQSILDRFAQARKELDGKEREYMDRHKATEQEIRAKSQSERLRLDAEYDALLAKLAPSSAELGKKLAELGALAMQHRFTISRLEKDLERYGELSFGRYVSRVVGIHIMTKLVYRTWMAGRWAIGQIDRL